MYKSHVLCIYRRNNTQILFDGIYYIPLCSKLDALGHQGMFLCYARLECTDHMYVVCLLE
jgi:hypothetical protein